MEKTLIYRLVLYARMTQGIGIDDPVNGLPLFKPLEDAFDSLKLCITVEPT